MPEVPTHVLSVSIPLVAANDAAARVMALEVLKKLNMQPPAKDAVWSPCDPHIDALCHPDTKPWHPPCKVEWEPQKS